MVDLVNFQITSTLTSFASEKRFSKNSPIINLKGKLELITGSSPGFMHLELYNRDNKFICNLDSDEAMLGSYPVEDGARIHVIDKDPTKKTGEFEDLSNVEKYEMPEGTYESRTDSVRNFLKQRKMGKYSEDAKQEEERAKQKELEEEIKAKTIKVGDRCETSVPKQPTKRGTVMYIGLTEFRPGWWIGVRYDEPLGKNDGSVQGKRYFQCDLKYGGFVRPSQVIVGDFPEEDLGFDEMDEM